MRHEKDQHLSIVCPKANAPDDFPVIRENRKTDKIKVITKAQISMLADGQGFTMNVEQRRVNRLRIILVITLVVVGLLFVWLVVFQTECCAVPNFSAPTATAIAATNQAIVTAIANTDQARTAQPTASNP